MKVAIGDGVERRVGWRDADGGRCASIPGNLRRLASNRATLAGSLR